MLLAYGNTVCSAKWKINESIPLGYSRVYYVYGGEVLYQDERCTTYLKPGYLYIFPSASTYCMRQSLNNRLHCTFMHIDFFPSHVNELIEIQIDMNKVLKHILSAITESILLNDVKLVYALVDVFVIYCREHQLITSPDNQISRILLYIADHIKEDITIEKLSSLAGYNEQYFIRLFKQNVGVTPYQYVVSYRLKEAKKRLRSAMSISEIAKTVGYSDVKSFSRAFKHNFGFSPSIYKNNYLGQP